MADTLGDDLAALRLGYASHIHRAQGATVTRTLVVTGGWQANKEAPTSRHPVPAKAPIGTSTAKTSAPTGTTPTAFSGSPDR